MPSSFMGSRVAPGSRTSRGLHDEHGAGGLVGDRVRHAAEHAALHPAIADHEQVGPAFLGKAHERRRPGRPRRRSTWQSMPVGGEVLLGAGEQLAYARGRAASSTGPRRAPRPCARPRSPKGAQEHHAGRRSGGRSPRRSRRPGRPCRTRRCPRRWWRSSGVERYRCHGFSSSLMPISAARGTTEIVRSNDVQPSRTTRRHPARPRWSSGWTRRRSASAVIEVCDPSSFDDETLEQLNAALARRIIAGMRDEAPVE